MILTAEEYQTAYDKLLKKFAVSQTKSWQSSVYLVDNGYDEYRGKLLFLFCYVLSNYEHDETAINNITEREVIAIINAANRD